MIIQYKIQSFYTTETVLKMECDDQKDLRHMTMHDIEDVKW